MTEYLHATDIHGAYVKTEERKKLLAEIREHSLTHGDAPLAVPVVHIILMDSDGAIRLVKRGDKPENPYMWDKAVGGHVVSEETALTRVVFDANAKKEMQEEIGLTDVRIAGDMVGFKGWLAQGEMDLEQTTPLVLIDHERWLGGISKQKNGPPWLKRMNAATYMGVYDGPFRFMDGEAEDEMRIDKRSLLAAVRESPWQYCDGVRIVMERYYGLLRL